MGTITMDGITFGKHFAFKLVFHLTLIMKNSKKEIKIIFCYYLVANMLGNFSIALTYDLFITLGLITAVPVSAGTVKI